jgi:hypothetical protein
MCLSRLMTPNETCAVELSVWLTTFTVKCWMLFAWWEIYRLYYSYIHLCAVSVRIDVFASVCPCATCNRYSLSLLRFNNLLALSLYSDEFLVSVELSATLLYYLCKDMAAKRPTVRISQALRNGPAVTNYKSRCVYIYTYVFMNNSNQTWLSLFLKTKGKVDEHQS